MDFLRIFGEYALAKGEEWRCGEGAELVDAYETACASAPVAVKVSDPAITDLIEDMRLGAVSIRRWAPETFPENEHGQVHFVRALAESVAEAIEKFLSALSPAPVSAEPVAWMDRRELDYIRLVTGNDAWEEHVRMVPVGGNKEGRSPIYASPPDLAAEIARLREALEPFGLISSEGVVKAESGHVTVTTCAEYFHRARAALADQKGGDRHD